jgi:nicotinate phosphoribosyltransferase
MDPVGTRNDAGAEVVLTTDLYEITMAASYLALGIRGSATFSLFVRRLPPQRSFLVAAGLDAALSRIGVFAFGHEALEYVGSIGMVRGDVLADLADIHFRGDVRAVREGRVVFADEPILEVTAPIVEAQLVETAILNAIHFPTLVATKAARCVAAAEGRSLVDFGLRRTPGIEAGLAVARASYLAGFDATSNLLAGKRLGMPVSGTVAHSFIEIFPSELEAFRAFAAAYPGPVTLLVDTYDTTRGVARAVQVAHELSARGRRVAAVRLDSGDLATLSRETRRALDDAGLDDVRIVASGGLDEFALADLTRAGAPIDAYGVGTRLGMSADSPVLDMAYKIVAYDGRPCLKLSEGKETLVGPKQVWRRRGPGGRFAGDRIAAADEPSPGEGWEPLLEPVMRAGEPLPLPSLAELRSLHRAEIEALPPELLDVGQKALYPVERSPVLAGRQRAAVAEVRRREGLGG